jgi:hypothetical protein
MLSSAPRSGRTRAPACTCRRTRSGRSRPAPCNLRPGQRCADCSDDACRILEVPGLPRRWPCGQCDRSEIRQHRHDDAGCDDEACVGRNPGRVPTHAMRRDHRRCALEDAVGVAVRRRPKDMAEPPARRGCADRDRQTREDVLIEPSGFVWTVTSTMPLVPMRTGKPQAAEYSGEGSLMLSGKRAWAGGSAPEVSARTAAATTAIVRTMNFDIANSPVGAALRRLSHTKATGKGRREA